MPRTPRAQPINILKEATSRDFSGGLDVADSQLNLTSKYARDLENLVVGLDGSLEIRQGNRLFGTIEGVVVGAGGNTARDIVNMRYFAGYIIIIDERGVLFAMDSDGDAIAIWTNDIARQANRSARIWPNGFDAVFEEFNGELIVMNGRDKPLRVTKKLAVGYLADNATGSNINVPIGNVCASFSNHFFIAKNFMLYVSERNASGTWLNDAGAQFVNEFDMRPYVRSGDTEIIGLYAFKNYLLVAFREFLIPVQLVEDATATPKLNITVEGASIINQYGAISSRVGQDLGDAILICDIAGVSAISLTQFTQILSPDRPSRLIDPVLQPAINKLTGGILKSGTFSVYDRRLSAYTLYLPNTNLDDQQGSIGYLYRYVSQLKIKAWSKITGANWCCATRSTEGNVFFARKGDKKVFLQGDAKTNPMYADYLDEQDTFSDNTPYTDGYGNSPASPGIYNGVPINFAWELPWADLKHRGLSKTLRYVILDTEGTQSFTMQAFVDGMDTEPLLGEAFSDDTYFTDGLGFLPYAELPYTPALELDWIAEDAGAYGIQQYGNSPYGGGNNTGVRKLTLAPTKFNTLKLRFSGSTKGLLRFVAITLLYQLGTIRRLP